jgi:DNA modification methylase
MTQAPYTLHAGDCREVLASLPDASVDSIVTDPPYHLTTGKKGGSGPASVDLGSPYGRSRIGAGFMGMTWDGGNVAIQPATWAECLRVLKPGGHLLSFSGTRTYHRMACAIEDAGFELRDQIGWLYGQGFPKSRNLGGDWKGWGTALKPAWEPIALARKPFKGTVEANVLKYGTGALNIEACRVDSENLELGRWPANVIHDGSPDVLAGFPDAAGQLAEVSFQSKPRETQNTYGAMNRGHEPGATPAARRLDSGSAARFFYCAKANKGDRGKGNTHPTVKPTDLMTHLIRLVTPAGGLVLDPFMGSGSTGKAAMREGFKFIGIDQDPEYVEIARNRIDAAWRTAEVVRMAMDAGELVEVA